MHPQKRALDRSGRSGNTSGRSVFIPSGRSKRHAEQRDRQCFVLSHDGIREKVYGNRRLYSLRAMCEGLSFEQYPASSRSASMGKELHSLHGLYLPLSERSD